MTLSTVVFHLLLFNKYNTLTPVLVAIYNEPVDLNANNHTVSAKIFMLSIKYVPIAPVVGTFYANSTTRRDGMERKNE